MTDCVSYLRRIAGPGLRSVLLGLIYLTFSLHLASAAAWSVSQGNTVALGTAGVGFSVGEMSGVTYLGPSPVGGKHRFLTVQDNGAGLITFDAAFDLNGNLVSAQAIHHRSLSMNKDFEGIVQHGGSVFLSEENGPGVREYDPATGLELQNVSIPSLFTNNVVSNFGFESLAYEPQSARMWTANEEALAVDGPVSTPAAGTTVRLLELNVQGNTITAGSQYAYEVESIHGGANSSARSGLAELVALPDGTLLGLERSAAVAFPALLNRIFEIDFSGATDVSAAPFNTGLIGKTYTPVGKELLWSGAAGGGFGQNLEGLAVGPRLPNGDWVLLGVVDNGDSLSGNTLVALRLASTTPIPFAPDTGDLDLDADSDGADLLAWQRGFGGTTLAGVGDGNQDGMVTDADLSLWEKQFGSSNLLTALQTVPEPSALALLLLAGASRFALSRRRVTSRR